MLVQQHNVAQEVILCGDPVDQGEIVISRSVHVALCGNFENVSDK